MKSTFKQSTKITALCVHSACSSIVAYTEISLLICPSVQQMQCAISLPLSFSNCLPTYSTWLKKKVAYQMGFFNVLQSRTTICSRRTALFLSCPSQNLQSNILQSACCLQLHLFPFWSLCYDVKSIIGSSEQHFLLTVLSRRQ